MSTYKVSSSSDPSYTVISGYDPMLRTFFAQVFRRRRPSPVLWLGATEIITDLEVLRTSLAPYGSLPITVCANLLRDQSIDQERPLPAALSVLLALPNRIPGDAMVEELDEALTYYLCIDRNGCRVCDWASLPDSDSARDEAFRKMIYGTQNPLPTHLEMVTGYFRNSSLLLLTDEYGVRKRLPLFIALPRRGEAYPGPVGPVLITFYDSGMKVNQVR